MSSEESEGEPESVVKTYRVNKMPWRRDLAKVIELLEYERRADRVVFGAQGAVPVPRIRDPRAESSGRSAVTGLPLEFYDKEWYASLTEEQKEELQVSEEVFGWMSFTIQR